jgi:hypothetical protein
MAQPPAGRAAVQIIGDVVPAGGAVKHALTARMLRNVRSNVIHLIGVDHPAIVFGIMLEHLR